MFLHDICNILNKYKIPYAVVGGFAVALHGAIRGTVDVDIAIKWTLDNLKQVEKAFHELQLVSLLPVNAEMVFQFRKEYIEQRNMIAWNFYDPKNLLRQVDIIISFDLTNAKCETKKTPHGTVRVISKKDLINMKLQSGRPQDLADVKALEDI